MIGMTPEILEKQAQEVFAAVVKAVKNGECNLFLGSAVHAPPPPGHPRYTYAPEKRPLLGGALSRMMAQISNYETAYPGQDPTNLLRVAQHFEAEKGRGELVSFVREQVETGKEPSPALQALAALDFTIVITTNYDTLFEQALARAGKKPFVSVYKPKAHETGDNPAWNDRPTLKRPMLFKMHGDIEKPASIVITDEDYIQFILRMREVDYSPIPKRIQTSLMERPTLFVGYSLKDYNLRVLLKTLRTGLDEAEFPPAFAIDRSPDALIWEFWYNRAKPRIVDFAARDVWVFVPELYASLMDGAEMPQ